jgi:prolyl-tRNA synthetase
MRHRKRRLNGRTLADSPQVACRDNVRASQLFLPTLRQPPAEAEAASHKLLVRGAFIRQVSAGLWTFLPLGWRVHEKVVQIVREEINAIGGQEMLCPVLTPAELWQTTGRYDKPEIFKLEDRNARQFVLSLSHEETFTFHSREIQSYKQLPQILYHFQTKDRDEPRPRGGLLRVREFIMKDSYSFDRDEEGLERNFEAHAQAYHRIFERCGLEVYQVEAEVGIMGGTASDDFLAPAASGANELVRCENCDYAADIEAASAKPPEPASVADLKAMVEVSTPGRSSIAAVSELLDRRPAEMLKCMMYDASGETVAVLVPGDREVNEEKVGRAMWPAPVRPLTDEDFGHRGLIKGFVGPQGLPADVIVIADHSVRGGKDWVTGANKADFHVTGANEGRDFRVDRWEDVTQVREGDPCPVCGGTLILSRGVVLGHTYQLGTRYSKPLKATFVDEDGTEQPFQMGCYGIGVDRIVAAAAEQFNDEAGLKWPKVLAPYQVVVIPTNMDQPAVVEAGERLYGELQQHDFAVVIDDREVTAGVKFADADLIGYPLQVVVGKRGIESGSVDLKLRASGERSSALIDEAAGAAVALLESAP